MLNEVYEELDEQFDGAVKALQRDLSKIRTGRANPAIFDGLRVDYYGTPTPLNQVGAIKVADANMLTIQPWEKEMIPKIEKVIMTSSLGLNPANDGTLVRVPVPPLTGERRQELVKMVKRAGEDRRVVARNYRRDANDTVKMLEKEKEISEDEMHSGLKVIQDRTDKAIARINALVADKEKEITED